MTDSKDQKAMSIDQFIKAISDRIIICRQAIDTRNTLIASLLEQLAIEEQKLKNNSNISNEEQKKISATISNIRNELGIALDTLLDLSEEFSALKEMQEVVSVALDALENAVCSSETNNALRSLVDSGVLVKLAKKFPNYQFSLTDFYNYCLTSVEQNSFREQDVFFYNEADREEENRLFAKFKQLAENPPVAPTQVTTQKEPAWMKYLHDEGYPPFIFKLIGVNPSSENEVPDNLLWIADDLLDQFRSTMYGETHASFLNTEADEILRRNCGSNYTDVQQKHARYTRLRQAMVSYQSELAEKPTKTAIDVADITLNAIAKQYKNYKQLKLLILHLASFEGDPIGQIKSFIENHREFVGEIPFEDIITDALANRYSADHFQRMNQRTDRSSWYSLPYSGMFYLTQAQIADSSGEAKLGRVNVLTAEGIMLGIGDAILQGDQDLQNCFPKLVAKLPEMETKSAANNAKEKTDAAKSLLEEHKLVPAPEQKKLSSPSSRASVPLESNAVELVTKGEKAETDGEEKKADSANSALNPEEWNSFFSDNVVTKMIGIRALFIQAAAIEVANVKLPIVQSALEQLRKVKVEVDGVVLRGWNSKERASGKELDEEEKAVYSKKDALKMMDYYLNKYPDAKKWAEQKAEFRQKIEKISTALGTASDNSSLQQFAQELEEIQQQLAGIDLILLEESQRKSAQGELDILRKAAQEAIDGADEKLKQAKRFS